MVASDGMVIEQWVADEEAGFSMEAVAAEVTLVIGAARSLSINKRGQIPTELTLKTADWSGVVRSLADGYFFILLAEPDTLMGRARFVVERAVPLIETDLA